MWKWTPLHLPDNHLTPLTHTTLKPLNNNTECLHPKIAHPHSNPTRVWLYVHTLHCITNTTLTIIANNQQPPTLTKVCGMMSAAHAPSPPCSQSVTPSGCASRAAGASQQRGWCRCTARGRWGAGSCQETHAAAGRACVYVGRGRWTCVCTTKHSVVDNSAVACVLACIQGCVERGLDEDGSWNKHSKWTRRHVRCVALTGMVVCLALVIATVGYTPSPTTTQTTCRHARPHFSSPSCMHLQTQAGTLKHTDVVTVLSCLLTQRMITRVCLG